eukprot:jgi/Bigna1/70661/fgenesh1_pg.12_\
MQHRLRTLYRWGRRASAIITHRRLSLFSRGSASVIAGAGIVGMMTMNNYAESKARMKDEKNWPIYKRSEVAQHKTKDTRIWVTYKDGVYDITDFIEQHPGGMTRIMLAAGGAIDPFWALYQQHMVDNVLSILKEYRIGSLSTEEVNTLQKDINDPYKNDPERHPALLVHKQKPFNAGTPPQLIPDNFLTPA